MTEKIKQGDLGDETSTESNIVLIPKEVRFYLMRLADLVDTRNHINRGAYPMSGYEGVPLMEGPVQKDDPNLQPTLYGKGLRWGVSRGIYGTRNMLATMGYGKEADKFLKIMDKQPEIQKQAEGQKEGNQ